MANKKSGRNGSRNTTAAPPPTNAMTAFAATSAAKAASAASELDNMRKKLGISPSMVMYSTSKLQLTFIEALYDCILFELALKKLLHHQHKDVAVRYAKIQMAFAYALAPLLNWRDDLYNAILSSQMHSSPAAVEAFAKTTSAIRVKGLYPYNRRAYVGTDLVDLGKDYEGFVAVDSLIERSTFIASEGEEDSSDLSDEQHLGYFVLPKLAKRYQQIFHERYITMVPKDYHDPIAVIIFTLRRLWGSAGRHFSPNDGSGNAIRLVKRDRFGIEEYTQAWTQKHAVKYNIKRASASNPEASQSDEQQNTTTPNGSLHSSTSASASKDDMPPLVKSTTKENLDNPTPPLPPPPPPSKSLVVSEDKKEPQPQVAPAEKKVDLTSQTTIQSESSTTTDMKDDSQLSAASASKGSSGSQQKIDGTKEADEAKPAVSASNEKRTSQPTAATSFPSNNSLSRMTTALHDTSDTQKASAPISKDKLDSATVQTTKNEPLLPTALSSKKDDSNSTESTSKPSNASLATPFAPKDAPVSQPTAIAANDASAPSTAPIASTQAGISQSLPATSKKANDTQLSANQTGSTSLSTLFSTLGNDSQFSAVAQKFFGFKDLSTTTSNQDSNPQPPNATPTQDRDTQSASAASKQVGDSQPSATAVKQDNDAQQATTASKMVNAIQQPVTISNPVSDMQPPAAAAAAATVAPKGIIGTQSPKPAVKQLGDTELPVVTSKPATTSLQPTVPSNATKQSQLSNSSSLNGLSLSSQLPSESNEKPGSQSSTPSLKEKGDTQQASSLASKDKSEAQPKASKSSGSSTLSSLLDVTDHAVNSKSTKSATPKKSNGLLSQTLTTAKSTSTAATITAAMAAATANLSKKSLIGPDLSKTLDEASPDNAPPFYCDLDLVDYYGPNPDLELYPLQLNGSTRIQFYQTLSQQINVAYQSVLPDAKTVANHAELQALLQETFSDLHPGPHSKVLAFGSYCNGLLMNDSDADFCIAGDPRENDPALADMMILALYLEDIGMEDIQVVDQATVPIVKFVDPHTKLNGDINYGNRLGVVNSEMIKMYTEIDIRCKKLLYLVKLLCRRQGINDSSKGTLSSYALNMLGITFLQNQDPPILPRLQVPSGATTTTKSVDYYQRGREGMIWRRVVCTYDKDLERYRDFGKANRKSIGRLLLEFFEFYSRYYDYTNWEVSPALGAFAVQKYRGPLMSGMSQQPWGTSNATSPSMMSTTPVESPDVSMNSSSSTFPNSTGHSGNNNNNSYFSPRAGTFRVVDPFLPQRNLVGTCRGNNIELVWRTFDRIYKALSEGDLYKVL